MMLLEMDVGIGDYDDDTDDGNDDVDDDGDDGDIYKPNLLYLCIHFQKTKDHISTTMGS